MMQLSVQENHNLFLAKNIWGRFLIGIIEIKAREFREFISRLLCISLESFTHLPLHP
jgi:hypothetical protein